MKFYGNMNPDSLSFLQFDKIYNRVEDLNSQDEVFLGRFVLLHSDEADYDFGGEHYRDNNTVWQKIYLNNKFEYIKIAELNAIIPEIEIQKVSPSSTNGYFQLIKNNDSRYTIQVKENWNFDEQVVITEDSGKLNTAELLKVSSSPGQEPDTLRLKLNLPFLAQAKEIADKFNGMLGDAIQSGESGILYNKGGSLTSINVNDTNFQVNNEKLDLTLINQNTGQKPILKFDSYGRLNGFDSTANLSFKVEEKNSDNNYIKIVQDYQPDKKTLYFKLNEDELHNKLESLALKKVIEYSKGSSKVTIVNQEALKLDYPYILRIDTDYYAVKYVKINNTMYLIFQEQYLLPESSFIKNVNNLKTFNNVYQSGAQWIINSNKNDFCLLSLDFETTASSEPISFLIDYIYRLITTAFSKQGQLEQAILDLITGLTEYSTSIEQYIGQLSEEIQSIQTSLQQLQSQNYLLYTSK